MSAVADRIDVDALAPDGIEPVEFFRTWRFDGKVLSSVNTGSYAWTPGEPLHAECAGGTGCRSEWTIERHGLSLDMARALAERDNESTRLSRTLTSFYSPPWLLEYVVAPSVEPPPGYGYRLVQTKHEAPGENCSCGIYAAAKIEDCPSADVWGKVKMWGKIVPGSSGARGEYAYPSELHVPAKWADNPALLAYGVPLIVEEAAPTFVESAFTFSAPTRPRMSRWLMFSVALNLGACALNLTLMGLRLG